MNFKEIKQDLMTFSDDEEDILVEKDGSVIFTRNGKDELIKVVRDTDTGGHYIEYNGHNYSYHQYLGKHLANLELFATKLVERRSIVDPFIDSSAHLHSASQTEKTRAIQALDKECKEQLASGTKLTFITADAGHGKTALLKEYQRRTAKAYLEGSSKFIFWHVDLQGRELVRLNEAIMYDLADLRMPGLFYSSVLTLIKRGHIVLAIDGFDELAAEIGGTVALGALSSLVSLLENQGTIVAASRRTFFDTQDYIKRTRLLERTVSNDCEFHEMKLQNWTKVEFIEFAGHYFDNPDTEYSEILQELKGNEIHPLICRPFLASKLVTGMSAAEMSAKDFIGAFDNNHEGISTIVQAFVRREVSKWKLRDSLTGEPYLTIGQHIELLEKVAVEMWFSKSESISVEEIELETAVLCDQWEIDNTIRPTIMNMVKSHAFLIPPDDSDSDLRKFEHEEFRNYFLSQFLVHQLKDHKSLQTNKGLLKFLNMSQMPESIVHYSFIQNSISPELSCNILSQLEQVVSNEWKPTYLQTNIGTIVPGLLELKGETEHYNFEAKVNFTSLVMENRSIHASSISNANFINVSFKNTKLYDVSFENCHFGHLQIHTDTDNKFEKVVLSESNRVDSISLCKDGVVISTAYSPEAIVEVLESTGIVVNLPEEQKSISTDFLNTPMNKAAVKFINAFNRGSVQYERNIKEEGSFSNERRIILDTIIPKMIEFGLLTEVENSKSKQASSTAWKLKYSVRDILYANSIEETSVAEQLSSFWKSLR